MNILKKGTLIFVASLLPISSVLAENHYIVDGESMAPTIKKGDIIELTKGKYKDGDIVVAKTKQDKFIIKRVQGNKLIGDNGEKSATYNIKDVTILGKANQIEDAKEKKYGENLVVVQAAGEITKSPIKKAYAGHEFTLFMHDDTSITGFGSNEDNVLGMTGGTNNNTGELVQVSGNTGFNYLKVHRDVAYGFRPDADDSTKFQWVRIREPLQNEDKPRSELVLDADRPYYDSHDSMIYVDLNGYLHHYGSDYWEHLGIGEYNPRDRYPNNWNALVYEPLPAGYTHTNQFSRVDNVGETTVTTEPFVVNNGVDELWHVRVSVKNKLANGSPYIRTKIMSADGTILVKDFGNLNLDGWSIREYLAENVPNGTYTLQISSKDLSWDAYIYQNKKVINNAKKVVFANERGNFAILTENNDIYVHYNGWGYPQKVNIPAGVNLDYTTLQSGNNSVWAIMDTDGKLYTFTNATNMAIVNFPNVDGVPFYDNNKIVEVSIGSGFYMAVSETKDTNKTRYAWVWGKNDYGRMGLSSDILAVGATSNTPIKVSKKGVALENIQSVAAGQYFSVIVQNTNEGQLVWTSGRNNAGQLGGGIQLTTNEPALVPGLKNIENVFTYWYGTDVYAVDTNGQSYKWGADQSFPSQKTILSGADPIKKYVDNVYSYMIKKSDGLVMTLENGAIVGSSGNKAINEAKFDYLKPIKKDANGNDMYDGSSNPIRVKEFYGAKDVSSSRHGGNLIDSEGKVWSTGSIGGHGNQDETQFYYGWGTRSNYFVPALNASDKSLTSNFEKIEAGDYFTIGLRVDPITQKGEVYGWGEVPHANGTGGSYWVRPVKNDGGILAKDIEQIDAGVQHSIARDSEGGLWVWGLNNYGQLGLGKPKTDTTNAVENKTTRTYPVKVDPSSYGNKKVIYVAAGDYQSYFITEDGSVWSIGDNELSQLGNGNSDGTSIPQKVLNITNAVKVSAGDNTAYAIDSNGRVWAWGYAANGSLGNNFSVTRSELSTAVGNALPKMTIESDLITYYLSKNGKKEFNLEGTIAEPDKEDIKIKTSLLGVEKTLDVTKDSWELDIYDQVKPQNWKATWNVDEISNEMTYQSLTKVVAEDGRGGLLEQFFAGRIIVDNEMPTTPNWGETCFLDVNTRTETSCSTEPIFTAGGKNGVNHPIRLYLNVTQKSGENKAPVRAQISYRKKATAGFYLNDWSDWTEVKKNENNEFYYDFYEGFLGETQIKVRGIDEAENITSANDSSRYVIITNAGGEIKSATAKAFSDENYMLYNQLTFVGSTPSGSAIQSYNIDRRDKLKAQKNPVDEEGNSINHWVNLTPERVSWDGLETIFTDNNLVEELKGNAVYEYKIDAKNNISIGQPKIVEITTNPYVPENLAKAPDDTGMVLSISQDKRNQGSILYRLVITDNMTGNVFTKDYTSSNVNEDIVYDLRGNEVFTQSGVKIVNNSIKIQVLVQGSNKQWVEVLYEENFINSPAISTDTQKPDVMFMIPELYKTIVNGKYSSDNRIQLSLFATDNVSPRHKLQVQFSLDGTNWIGLKQVSPTQKEWIANHWSGYQDIYDNFAVGTSSGKKIIYVRVQDEAGNVTYANTEMVITDPLNRTNPDTGTTTPINDPINGTVVTDFTETNERHIKSPNTKITVPKDGNLTEVQFSFNGIKWSPWEKIGDSGLTKYITLPYGNGNRTIMVRYKNDSGLVTDVESNSDIITYVLDEEKPAGEIKTRNGTLLSTKFAVPLKFFVEDNLSSQVKVTVVGQNENGQPFTLNKVYVNAQGEVDVNTNADGFINGNKVVLDTGTPILYGVAGLVPNKFNEVRFKLEDKAGNVTYKTIRIFYKG